MKKLIRAIAAIIILATAIVVALIFQHALRVPLVNITFLGATHSLAYWIGFGGTLYIAFATPVYPIVKRKFPRHLRKTLNIHIIGNLLAVLLVSVHFAQQLTRPPSSYPNLGTGIVLETAMVLLVSAGMVLYSNIFRKFAKQQHFLHAAFAVTFYTVIAVHVLHGLSII